MLVSKVKVVPNNKMKIVKKKSKKKMSPAQDAAYDRKHGIKAGSKEDQVMDQKNGVTYKKKAKSKKKLDMSNLSGHNEAKQNGGSESKLHKGKRSKTKNKNWIAGAIKKPGALHAELGVKQGSKIPAAKLAAAASKGGKEGQRARLAETLKGFHKSKSAGQKAYLKRVGTKGMQC